MLHDCLCVSLILILLCLSICFAENKEKVRGRFGSRLLDAAYIADVDSVRNLLEKDPTILTPDPPCDVNDVDKLGRNALMLCGLDPQVDSRADLDDACEHIFEFLDAAGINISHVDNNSLNAVHYGAVKGMTKVVTRLCDKGAPCDMADENGRTPVMKAVTHGFRDTYIAFVTCGANLDNRDVDGLTILHYITRLASANSSFVDFLTYILSNKTLVAGIDVADSSGRTALMYASLTGSEEVLTTLLHHGADPRPVDIYGISAVQMTKDPHLQSILAEATIEYIVKLHDEWEKETTKREENWARSIGQQTYKRYKRDLKRQKSNIKHSSKRTFSDQDSEL